jgi:endonuclease VIII-like 1
MPELAELAIMSDFVNKISESVIFEKLEKSEVSKVKTDLSEMNFSQFTVSAKSRGKEMILEFFKYSSTDTVPFHKKLLMTMGMSGNWKAGKEVPKHSHLYMRGHLKSDPSQQVYLCMVDVRRFAKWTWKEEFSQNRGPCPVKDHEKFKAHFHENVKLLKRNLRPILDVMMDQAIFNGIGNYLRAEILYRADVNPFLTFSEISQEETERILDLCKVCPIEAYQLGGGQMKDWKNSFQVEAQSFSEWMKMYQKGKKIFDAGKRVFWYDGKWEETEAFKKYV